MELVTRYRCPVRGCGFTTHTIRGLKLHYRKMHPDWCFVCEKLFRRPEALTNHAYRKALEESWGFYHAAMYYLAMRHLPKSKDIRSRVIYRIGADALAEITAVEER